MVDSPHSLDAVIHLQVISEMFFAKQQQQVAVYLGRLKSFHDVLFDWQLQPTRNLAISIKSRDKTAVPLQ